MTSKIRVLLAKPGLDGHDNGVKLVARALRDAGMEVIYLGMRQTAQGILEAARQEDVDVIGISTLSGIHVGFAKKLLAMAKELGMQGTPVVFGGVIPEEDLPTLREIGVQAVFTVGSPFNEIAAWFKQCGSGRKHDE
jgi:methylmalonyl-CoA mutase, C-terminal domain